jgi:4-amino-4-deoxy-L-arabinose transferase-like glycosyltransferase
MHEAETSPLIRHRLLLLVALGLALYVPFLSLRDLWYPDEPEIAEVAKAMYESGDWVAPRRMGQIWVDYPPMLYWAGAASSHVLGGVSELSLRLPNALAAIALVALVCVAGSRWFGERAGLAAGFALLTFQQFAYQAVSYRPDVFFALFIAAGLLVYAAGAGAGGPPRAVLRVIGFALLGLAMLSKGPLGLLLPGLVLTLWHGGRREWRRLLELAPLSLVAAAVYLAWFVPCARAMGAPSILHELWAQNVARFFGGARGHGQPWHYYLTAIWADLAPWSLLLPLAAARALRREGRNDAPSRLAILWLGAFLAFLSLAVTKRQLYLLPAYPAAALLLAPWLDAITQRPSAATARPARVYALVLSGLLVLIGVVVLTASVWIEPVASRIELTELERTTLPALRAPLAAVALLLVAGGTWIALAARRGSIGTALVRIGVVHVALYAVLLAWLLPAMNPFRTYRPQAEWVRDAIGASTHLGLAYPARGVGKRGAFGYYTGKSVDLVETPEELEHFFERNPDSLVLVHDDAVSQVLGAESVWRDRVVRELWITRDRYLVVRAARDTPPPDGI